MKTVRKAPAKVNLFLRMDGRREDGYHLLYSVMQTISVYDTIEVEVLLPDQEHPAGIHFDSNCWFLSSDPKKNTAVKAATLFMEADGEKRYVSINLDKQIPSQAGLGGGSSDAAAVLLALQELLPGHISDEQLLEMALKIGADVPFFIKGGTVLCEGVGEIMTELSGLAGIPMLLMKPEQGVSTPRCYAKFDEMDLPQISAEEKAAVWESLQPIDGEDVFTRAMRSADFWKNDLQKPAMTDVPCMQDGLDLMKQAGASFVAMSGSGSAIFGLFQDEKTIDAILQSPQMQTYRKNGWWICRAGTI